MLDFRQFDLRSAHADQDIPASEARLLRAEQLAQHALHPIAVDRARKNAFRNDEPEPGNAKRVGAGEHAESGTLERASAREQRGDIRGPEAQPSTVTPARAQTPNRVRPLARRARITARPPRVRMRTRNP